MALFSGNLGLHYVTHIATQYSLPQWMELGELAHQKGFHQLWINDNVGYRPPFVVLTAIASRVPIRMGMAVLVPYFHHPLHVADSLAALSEFSPGREISVGLARGSLAITSREVEMARPLTMVREYAQFLGTVLREGEVHYRDYPLVTEYYRLNPQGKFHLSIRPLCSFRFYGGGIGPRSLRVTGRHLDGLISSGTFISMVKAGRQKGLLEVADRAAGEAGGGKQLHKVCELNLSLSRDRASALEFPRRQVAQAALQWETFGFTPEEYDALGVKREQVLELQRYFRGGGPLQEAGALVNEDMVRAAYVAGRPEEVIDQVAELCRMAQELGYHQISFSKLGPDYAEAVSLLANEVLPALGWEKPS